MFCSASPHALRSIGAYVTHLQEIKLNHSCMDGGMDEVSYLSELRCLRKVQLNLSTEEVCAILKVFIGKVLIEDLEIIFDRQPIRAALEYIKQLKHIKKLRLHTSDLNERLSDEHLIDLGKNLVNLEELHLDEVHYQFYRALQNYAYKSKLSIVALKQIIKDCPELKLLKIQSIDSIQIEYQDYLDIVVAVKKRQIEVRLKPIQIEGAMTIDVSEESLKNMRKYVSII